MNALSARFRRSAPDAGITMVELMVAAVISLMVLTLVGTMFIQVTRLASDARATKAATGNAWVVMDEITRVIRQGTQVATGSATTEGAVIAGSTATALSIDSSVDATVTAGQVSIAPKRVTFAVNASGDLVSTRITGSLSGRYYSFTGTASTKTLPGPVLTTDPLFTYWTGSADAQTEVVPGSSGLTAAQAATVNAVTVNVVIRNTLSTTSDPVRLSNMVTMPNIAIVNGGN